MHRTPRSRRWSKADATGAGSVIRVVSTKAMPQLLQYAGMVLGLTAIALVLLAWLERRRRKRCESWHCPKCGVMFGSQAPVTEWGIRRDPEGAGVPTGGPVLRCSACGREYRFSWSGRLVNESGEYA